MPLYKDWLAWTVLTLLQRKMGRLPFMTRAPNEADIEAMLRDCT
jgi:hypothetical protein